jgi:hypothetical protein
MTILYQQYRSPISAIIVLLFLRSAAEPVFGQPAALRPASIVTSVGETNEPKMTLFQLELRPGTGFPGCTHDGAVFAYVIEGEARRGPESLAPVLFVVKKKGMASAK